MVSKKNVLVTFVDPIGGYHRDAKTEIINETENDKIIIPIKVCSSGRKWTRANRKFASFAIEPISFTFLEKIKYTDKDNLGEKVLPKEGKRIIVDSIWIVFKDLKNKLENISDILCEETEIKLKLGNDWSFWESDEKGRFYLEIHSDYEIITPTETFSFPPADWKGWETKEMIDKWNKEEKEEEKLKYKELFQEIKNNLDDWRIEGEKIINKNGNNHYIFGMESYLEGLDREEWFSIKKQLKNEPNILKQVIQELQEKKLVDCEKINQLERIEVGLEYSKLSSEEKKELSEAVFENLKKNREEWNIKEIITLDCCGRDDYQTKQLLIIHSSAQLKYNADGILVYDRKKMWEKSLFTQEQWKELEETIPFSSKKQQVENEPTNNNFPVGKTIFFVFLSLLVLVGGYFAWKRIKNVL